MRKRFEIIMSVLMIMMVLAASIYYNLGVNLVFGAKQKNDKETEKIDEHNVFKDITIVIDAGHGGYDPGKVGINNKLEKDLNLEISLKLRDKCEEAGMNVVMTRSLDETLAETGTNKKISDMENRMKIINAKEVDICISIHQNSYSSKDVKGAQVFYHSQSKEGERLAGILQKKLIDRVDTTNRRKEKSNNSYYILKKSVCTSVIVECGFLSNWEDATNLADEYYQEKIADALCEGVKSYIQSVFEN